MRITTWFYWNVGNGSSSFACKKRISLKHEGEFWEFEKVMQTLDALMQYFSDQWERAYYLKYSYAVSHLKHSLFQLVIMTEVPPEPCLPSGYDDEFVEPVNGGLQCGICRLPMKDPMITNCGHHFCRGCIEEHLRRYGNRTQEN